MVYPKSPLVCGSSALWHPLAPNSDNALNPCFLTAVFFVFALTLALAGTFQLIRYNLYVAYGPLSAKNTGLSHWLRCLLVVLHNLVLLLLTYSVSLYERYSDHKLIAFWFLTCTTFAVVTPLHIIETSRSPIPLGVLLCFWPVLGMLELMLYLQDRHTQWPVFLAQNGVSLEFVAFVLSFTVFVFEFSKKLWRPTHLLVLAFSKSDEQKRLLGKPNLVEKFTFTWMNTLITNSYKHQTLEASDLPPTPPELTTEMFTEKLKKYWDDPSKPKSKSRLMASLVKSFGPLALVSFLFEGSDSLLSFVQPQLLRLLIIFIGDRTRDPSVPILKGVLICFAMFLVTLLQTAVNNQYVLRVLKVGLGCRSSLTSLIFQKSLNLSSYARSQRSTGDIVNLISIDAPRIGTCAQELSTLIIAPTELVICIWSLHKILGNAAFAGVAAVIIVMPINSIIVRYLKKCNKTQMKMKDYRNRITNEILVSMKSIKLYAWETPLLNRLLDARNNKELKNLRKIRGINTIGNVIWVTLPFLVSFATFASFATFLSTPLTSDIVFPALALLNILAKPITLLPSVINYITEASVALDRIASFLLAPEIDNNLTRITSADDDEAVRLKNISFFWDNPKVEEITEETDFKAFHCALRNVNITARKGDFVCIVGKVGSGKLSLLSSINGQLDALDSKSPYLKPSPIEIHGTVAFCSQNPWIMNSSVKENITFGHKFEEDFYNRTIEACELLADLKILPDGDATQVGEKGISLSGGQKARLALARAVYARADIYLLDDVLSAVDSHVGKNIIAKVLSKRGLLAQKTIILATNNMKVLEKADKIYLFEKGNVVEQGSLSDIRSSAAHPKLNELLDESGQSQAVELSQSPTPEYVSELDDSLDPAFSQAPVEAYRRASFAAFDWDPFRKALSGNRTGPTAEVSAKGKVKWDIYLEYVRSCSVTGVIVWIMLFSVATFVAILNNYWLKKWAERNAEIGNNSDALRYIGIYALLGMAGSVLTAIRGFIFWMFLGIRGGRVIHERMARRIMKAPMNFFERTPVGRIINRFSNDINKVDDALPRSINMFMSTSLKLAMTIAVVGTAIPMFLVVVLLLWFVYGYFQKYYICSQRELKRLVSITRSPIFAHFQESLTGVETIKSYRQSDRFIYINNANVDFNLKSLYMLRSINRWLSVRLQFIGSLIVWSSSSMLIYKSTTASPVSAGMVGFAMSYALQITDSLRVMVRMSAEVEANLVSVERCFEYCDLKMEEDPNGTYLSPPKGWPAHGQISLHDYTTQYAKTLDPVLKNISIDIRAGEKVGIVGRTGAGKSSMVLAIYRMIPPTLGSITIDNIDVTKLLLFDLRHNLSIIPQDSHLFDGTIRQNLDPFGEHSDEKLWQVLDHLSLKSTVETLHGGQGLDTTVNEGGSNFSAGQRQLMCLGRALLNPSQVLMLDEATAAVDIQTDKIIQATIRKEFKHKTIITIAHRLDTVMDCDRILALADGRVEEFDTPGNLLKDPLSIFFNLCKQGSYI